MTIELTLLTSVSHRGKEITAPRLRGLLALLAGEPRAGCGTGRLVDGLWPDEQPENPTKALQILVSRARSLLGVEVIASTPTGYRIALREDQVDAWAVQLHAAAGREKARAGDHHGAVAEAEEGLALWGGGPAEGAPIGDPLVALRLELGATHLSLVRLRALSLARAGRREEAVGPLAELVAGHPLDEEPLLELMRCQVATAGAAAALATYDIHRRRLRDELGTDPGPALQELHQELLRGQAPVVRRGVPHEPNPLLGREADIAAVTRLIHSSRVTSVVGPGGLGKTRLASAVAREAEHRVVHLVPLAGVRQDADVAGEVASALGVGDSLRAPTGGFGPPADALAGIVGALGPGPALLVLDNCEQVVSGVAGLVQALVSMTRNVSVLTTSRAPLGLSSETVHPLPELDPATTVELFEQRARAARPGVELPTDAVADLCHRLDGLPLATELAAARVRVMSVAEIARRLEDRFALLRGGPRDAPQRHRTLHAVVDWSWNLLEPAGRTALRALAVFPGGFTATAAEHVLADLLGDDDTLDVLADLVDQSLLKVTDTAYGSRFRMLETVREFAAAHRERAGEDATVEERFLHWARDFGVEYHDAPFGPDPLASWHLIRAEQDNLVQAVRIALARADADTVATVTAVLAGLWTTDANYARLIALTEDTAGLLSHYRPGPDYVEPARTAAALTTANIFLGVGPGAVRTLVTLRRLPPAPPDTLVRAVATVLSALPEVLGDHSALEALCDSDAPLLAGVANCLASYVWQSEHQPDRALDAARRMVAALGDRNIPLLSFWPASRVAELCLQMERGAEAIVHVRSALEALEEYGEWGDPIGLRWGMMLANLQTGDLDAAEHWLGEALRHQPDGEGSDAFVPDLGARAEIALARGDIETGLALWRRAVARLEHGASPVFGDELVMEPWVLELQAVAVTAHARHGRLDLVAGIATPLPDRLTTLLTRPKVAPHRVTVDFPVCGALLLALGTVDLSTGATARGVRLLALADRFRALRNFQPTMSSAVSREAASNADKAAYEDAVSTYADLDPEALGEAVLAVLGGGR
ncbi:LuxR family transcriptional regulator [Streptomyces viridochromogenes]|uniref:LuxR family transcriptional regulator n=1 Tax=Streptomyces viridochromogenes TaxID=1938 RepID=A0A0J7ZID2_STRVR|nr:BTAD domain-containing putative transcriptional regulator [Streptomyces viridochromogenes]KMS75791.1 LuxR family transcriptional regulator [Streptomyces viridochromogenes]